MVEASASRNKIISIGIRTDAQIEVTSQKNSKDMPISFKTSNIPNKLSRPKSLKIQHFRL